MERNADEAERETTDQKVAEYMSGHIGESFDGIISGISKGGLFVRLANTAEGMIAFRTMQDFFEFDERRLEARGRSSGRVFRIGQAIRIKVAAVDVILRRIDFVTEDSSGEPVHDRQDRSERKANKKRESRQRYSPKKDLKKKAKGRKGR